MNPLDKWPKARETAYLVQWIYNGVLAVSGAVLLVAQTNLTDAPMWYLYMAAVGPVLWTYLGLTAQNNVTGNDIEGKPVE